MDPIAARVLRYGGLGLLAAVVALAPYFQGLFFAYGQHVAETLLAAGFLLWLGSRSLERLRLPVLADGAELALLGLLLCYLLASFTAVFPQGQLNVVLEVLAGLIVFYVLRAEAKRQAQIGDLLGWVLVAAGAGVALIGLAPYVGLATQSATVKLALANWGLKVRLSSTFEYWNTYAIYALAMWIIAIGLALRARRRALTLPLAGVLGFLFGITFLLAASRGALLALPVGALLLAIALPRGQRLAGLLLLTGTLAVALAASKGVDGNAALSDWHRVYKWLAVGLVAAGLGGGAVAGWLMIANRWKMALTALCALALVAGGAWRIQHDGSLQAAANKLLPAKSQRLQDINSHDANVVLRLDYDRDAARMLRDRPVVGAGGEAWSRLYPQYQAYRYVASETHDHFMQVAVETGLPGLIAFVAFWCVLAWRLLRRPASSAGSILAAAALTIAAHSLIDFNLSYLSIWLLVMAAAGTAAADYPQIRWSRNPSPLVAGCVGVLVLILAAPQAVGDHYLKVGTAQVDQNKPQAALPALWRTATLLPLDPEPQAELALAQAGKPAQDEALRKAAQLDPHNPEWPYRLALSRSKHSDWPGAFAAAQQALQLQPTYGDYYEVVLDTGAQAAIKEALAGDAAAAPTIRALKAAVDQLEQQQQRSKPDAQLWPAAYPELTPLLNLRAGQSLALAGQYERAIPYLSAARTQLTFMPEAEIWLYLVAQQSHDSAAQGELAKRPWVAFLSVNPLAAVLQKASSLR